MAPFLSRLYGTFTDFSKIEESYLFSSCEDDDTERRKRFLFHGRGQLCCKLGQQLAVGSSSLQFGLLPLAICCHSELVGPITKDPIIQDILQVAWLFACPVFCMVRLSRMATDVCPRWS